MLRSLLIAILRTLFVSLPRLIIGATLFLFAWVAIQVGRIGSHGLFRVLAFVPVRLMLSPDDAKLLRDDYMASMDGISEYLIEEHYGQGHSREVALRKLEVGLANGEFLETRQYAVGEFGISLLFTMAAIGLVHYSIPSGSAEAVSLWIALATIVLLFSVSTRTMLVELLAYDEPVRGSLVENTKRFAWNNFFLSNHYPLIPLLMIKATGRVSEDFYRLTVYSFGVGLERSIVEEIDMTRGFTEFFLKGCKQIAREEEIPDEVPPASMFSYIQR